jgi:hypothetical protein
MRHILDRLGLSAVHFMLPGEGEGGGGTGDGSGAGAGAGAFKAPDGMPAEFVGKDADETLGKLLGGYGALNTRTEGLRTQLAQLPKPPDSPEKYTFTPSEKLAPYFGDAAKNPALDFARKSAHAAGIPDASFGKFIEGVYAPMIEAGLLQPPYDPKAEVANYSKVYGLDATTATRNLKENEAFANGLVGQIKLPEQLQKDAAASLVALTDTAGGNALIRALMDRLGENGIRVPMEGSGGSPGALSDTELDKLTSDPRIDPANEFKQDANLKYDPALRKKYDEGMAARGRAKYAGKQ